MRILTPLAPMASAAYGGPTTRAAFWQGRNLLYRANYQLNPGYASNTVAYANWAPASWYGGLVQTEPTGTTLSLYSNASTDNQIVLSSNLVGSYTTPPGIRFQRLDINVDQLDVDFTRYKMDGSFFPIFEVTSPANNLKLTFGGKQNPGNITPFAIGYLLIEDSRPGGKTILKTLDNSFWANGGVFPIKMWLNKGQIGPGPDAQPGDSPIWNGPTNIIAMFYLQNPQTLPLSNVVTTAGSTGELFPPDQDFINAMEYGGLTIKMIDPNIKSNIYGAYTTHDLYKGEDFVGRVNAYSNTTTITYGSEWWDFPSGNTVTLTNDSNSLIVNDFTTEEMANIVSFTTTQQAFPALQANIAYDLTVLRTVFTNAAGELVQRNTNVYIVPTVYDSTFVTKTSNGYANVLTTVGSEVGPIPIRGKQLDLSFYANNNTIQIDEAYGYSTNVCYIKNAHFDETLGTSNVTTQTILDIRQPSQASTINIASSPGGNIWSYYTNNFAEYEQGEFPANTLQFEEPGYDVIYDDKWQLTGLGNTVSITTHMGSFKNRVAGQLDSNTNSSFFIPGMDSTITNPYSSDNFVQQYNLDAELVSTKESYPGNTYPMSMLSITLSTANRLPITYVSTSDYKDKLSLLPPTDLTMNVYSSGGTEPVGGDTTLNLWYDSTYTVFSGPTPVSVDESSIETISGTTKNYNTNVAYTVGNIEIFSDAVSNITHSFKTYEPQTELEFHTYSNTMTLSSNTVDLTLRSNVAYDEFLRSSNLYYNSTIDIGSNVGQVEDFYPTRYNATFQHNDSVFFIGGGKKELGQSSSKCYKVKLDGLGTPVLGGDSVTVIPLTPDFPFAFYGGQCTLDTDNNFVYLFCPNNTNDLYKIEFDPVDEIFIGSWILVSTSWYYTVRPWQSHNLL